jgi:outer membrane receptor protein involved in Fe transport
VTISQAATGEVHTATADATGRYSVDLLKPGKYRVTATSSNFVSNKTDVFVALSQTTEVDVKMAAAGATTSVEVNAEAVPLIDQDNIALITTLTQSQIQNLPSPGGDVTTVAFTAPGVVVNSGGEYGNFSSFGLPGVSNLFVLNGFDNQDPFLNLNNSGSSNLTLGAGELSEVSIVQNGYNSQYGRAAGAIINYTTKSGTNHFHGLVDYYNNTSTMNANGWFNEYYGGARPHAVSNQWAANVGGPIIKDKAFFFADYEGLRYVLPGASGLVNFPTPQLQTYILGNVPANAVGLYTQAFAAYKSAPSYGSAVPVTNGTGPAQDCSGPGCPTGANNQPIGYLGCGDTFTGTSTGTGGTFGVDTPCMMTSVGEANNINKEWLFTIRGDYKISSKQDIYARYKIDHGSQPTYTNFINPVFNAVSIQPEDEGQLNDNYRITQNAVNSFTIAANWYSAYFGPASNAASAAEFPYYFFPDEGGDHSGTNNSSGLAGLGAPGYLTQGRDVTQYQVEDDFNYLKGRHTIKAGFNFRRDDVSDYDSEYFTIFPEAYFYDLTDFTTGIVDPNSTSCVPNAAPGDCYSASGFYQAFSNIQHAHLALYNIGIYAQDEFQASSKLKLTLGARIDRTGNPLCNDKCFSQYEGNFPFSGASVTTPYSAAAGGPIAQSNYNAYPSTQLLNFQPRFGFNYSPRPHTEIRGGLGFFSDLYPAGFLDGAIENFPNYNGINVYSGVMGTTGAGTLQANAAAANTAIESGFASGQSLTQISTNLTNQGVPFTPPSLGAYFPSQFKSPEFIEYSLQVQEQLGRQDAIIFTYAGNHGYNEVLTNGFVNASTGNFDQASNSYTAGPFDLPGVPETPLDPSLSHVTAYTNVAHSNYNGGVVTYKHSGHGITGELNYTWSHGLDFCSNGCIGEPFNGSTLSGQLTPSLRTLNLNYSNSDYDVRNNLAGDIVYEEPTYFHGFVGHTLGDGWIVGAKTYYRSSVPFSITTNQVLGFSNVSVAIPDLLTDSPTNTCVTNPHGGVTNGCLDASNFAPNQTDFGNLPRNSLRGPHFADTDLSLTKVFYNTERLKFELGGNAYNLFNHPNFSAPNSTYGTSSFGQIEGTLAPPTSPYGSFQGAAVTQRIVQVHGKLVF